MKSETLKFLLLKGKLKTCPMLINIFSEVSGPRKGVRGFITLPYPKYN
jgi:hypothetical protein